VRPTIDEVPEKYYLARVVPVDITRAAIAKFGEQFLELTSPPMDIARNGAHSHLRFDEEVAIGKSGHPRVVSV
jgi:hypothetical protein